MHRVLAALTTTVLAGAMLTGGGLVAPAQVPDRDLTHAEELRISDAQHRLIKQ